MRWTTYLSQHQGHSRRQRWRKDDFVPEVARLYLFTIKGGGESKCFVAPPIILKWCNSKQTKTKNVWSLWSSGFWVLHYGQRIPMNLAESGQSVRTAPGSHVQSTHTSPPVTFCFTTWPRCCFPHSLMLSMQLCVILKAFFFALHGQKTISILRFSAVWKLTTNACDFPLVFAGIVILERACAQPVKRFPLRLVQLKSVWIM